MIKKKQKLTECVSLVCLCMGALSFKRSVECFTDINSFNPLHNTRRQFLFLVPHYGF